MPSTAVYFVSPLSIAAIAGFLDVVGRVEVGLAGGKRDDVAPLGGSPDIPVRDADSLCAALPPSFSRV
jgi:hypothetical protein